LYHVISKNSLTPPKQKLNESARFKVTGHTRGFAAPGLTTSIDVLQTKLIIFRMNVKKLEHTWNKQTRKHRLEEESLYSGGFETW
jgi:hypothetical protein